MPKLFKEILNKLLNSKFNISVQLIKNVVGKKQLTNQNINAGRDIINTTNNNYYDSKENEGKKTLKTRFAKRLFEATDKMHIFCNEDDVIAKIHIGLKESSPNHLRSFINDIEPDKKYVDSVAEMLGINKKWLNGLCDNSGRQFEIFQLEDSEKNEIYKLVLSTKYLYTDIINIIINEGGELCGPMGTAIIVQKRDDYRYYCIFNHEKCFNLYNLCPENPYYINKEVGYFFNIYSRLKQKQWEYGAQKGCWLNRSSWKDNIFFVSDEDFYNLISGRIYPGDILKKQVCEDGYLIMDLFENNNKKLDSDVKYSRWFNDLKLMIKNMNLREA